MSKEDLFVLYTRFIDRMNDLAQQNIITADQHEVIVTEVWLDYETTKDAPAIRPLREPLAATVDAYARLKEIHDR